jgi:large subunit ribosomal protein L18
MKPEKRLAVQRRRRRLRVRSRIKRDAIRPRLSVFRSHRHTYAQIIDDLEGRTLVSANTRDSQLRPDIPYGGNKAAAAAVGRVIARKALEAGIGEVVLDRREYKYHGRVAALADAAREAGLVL